MGKITDRELEALAQPFKNNGYGKYLLSLAGHIRRSGLFPPLTA